MRILLLTQFYKPEERSAPTNLAAVAHDLQQRGHEVLVVTGFPNHPFGRIYEGYRQRWRQWDAVDGVRVLRVPLFPDHSSSASRRALNFGSFALSAATIGAWSVRRFAPHAVLVYLPAITNLLPVMTISAFHRIPIVYWETDLWPDALHATGRKLPGAVDAVIRWLDRAAHRTADRICVNSPGLLDRLVEKGVPREKLTVVTDWADESLFGPAPYDHDLARRLELDDRFNIIYGGNFGPAQGLEAVIEAAALLQENAPEIQVVLIGSGEKERSLKELAARIAPRSVRFLPRVPMSSIRHYFALADGLLVSLRPSPLFELQIPSKITAYLACGKPIVCAVSGSAAEVVRSASAGLCCTPGDARSLADAMMALHALSPGERESLGRSGRAAYCEHHTRAVQVGKIEALLEGVVNEGTA